MRYKNMKGDKQVIEHLNRILKNELTAINQYFLHSKIYKDWGITKLAEKEYEESIDEMKHADELIERILFLEGLPNLQSLGKLRIGENVNEMLQCDLDLEIDAISDLQNAVAYADEIRDYVSRELFNSILASEEGHVDWLETQLTSIEKMGIENFIQHQS
jgi:bacterioferritin